MSRCRKDMYFSVDVEADGPIPGPYSMVSIGVSAVGTFDGDTFKALDPEAETFYAELSPISENWIPEALAVSGISREHLEEKGADPSEVMPKLAAWIKLVTYDANPVFVAYPLSFDWLFTYWYFMNFGGYCPFGHSHVIDMKTMIAERAGRTITGTSKRHIPKHLKSSRKHTHNALDDAIEQGELFSNIFEVKKFN